MTRPLVGSASQHATQREPHPDIGHRMRRAAASQPSRQDGVRRHQAKIAIRRRRRLYAPISDILRCPTCRTGRSRCIGGPFLVRTRRFPGHRTFNQVSAVMARKPDRHRRVPRRGSAGDSRCAGRLLGTLNVSVARRRGQRTVQDVRTAAKHDASSAAQTVHGKP